MSLKRKTFVALNQTLAAMPRPFQRLVLGGASRLPFMHRPPRFMAIEPTNLCNLHCPLCPVGAGTMDRQAGFMDIDRFKRLVDEIAPHTRQVLMNFAGEPLLHPHIGDMVRYAEDHGIRITLGTHGNIDKMEELVEAGVSEVLFSLDGTTDETYQKYRIGGDRLTALKNLEHLVAARNASASRSTRIILQFVVMRHNHHQVDEIIALGREMGVDLVSLQPVCVNDFFTDELRDLLERWVPPDSPYLLHPEAPVSGKIQRPPLCVWAIQSVVLFNGDVTTCCFDASGVAVVGNAFAPGGFGAVWNSRKYRVMRKRILLQDIEICGKCDIGLVKPTRLDPRKEIRI